MKVHLIKKLTVDTFVINHAGSKPAFESWLDALKFSDWYKPSDIQNTFNTADILGRGCDRVVFNIGGNNYRIICQYQFGDEYVHLFICWIGTHAEYDKLNKRFEQFTVNEY